MSEVLDKEILAKFRLSVEQVYRTCSEDIFQNRVGSVVGVRNHLEQRRAVESLEMGVSIGSDGYNIFAMGSNGIGKRRMILDFLEDKARHRPISRDWVYVHNFDDSEKPVALSFRAGEAKLFKNSIDKMIEDLKIIIPSIFESDSYRSKAIEIIKGVSAQQEQSFIALVQQARKSGLNITKTDDGFAIAALDSKGVSFSPEAFNNLSETEKQQIAATIKGFQQKLEKMLTGLPLVEKEKKNKIAEYNEKIIEKTLKPFINKLGKKWGDSRAVANYLSDLLSYIITHYMIFLPQQLSSDPNSRRDMINNMLNEKQLSMFNINIIVDRSKDIKNDKGAPVIYLDNPNYGRVFGRIEYSTEMGSLSTDFTNIKGGYLHRANGGYLVINALKLLEIPVLWESLKQVLKDKKIQFLNPETTVYNTGLITLDPEPIPLDIKIILIGEPSIYYALWQYDPEFKELFKIVADFDSTIPYNKENVLVYANYVQSFVKENKIRDVNNSALVKIVEIGAKLADSQELLSTNLSRIKSVLIEANYIAKQKKVDIISSKEILEAYKKQKERTGKFAEYMEKNITKKIILVQTEGTEVGQINGLAVYSVNDSLFGQPQRITSNVHKGKNGIVDIERVVSLSGSIHHKGVMILQSFLNSRFGQKNSLSLTATIVFEQSYGMIDGDSATSTELYALLSALSGVPLKQSLAVTGSMDQKGRVQAIGGVNHKITGFFNICKQNTLDGTHGVIIPKSNIADLMLPEEIREAIKANLFNIYAVSHVDEGIEILTGIPAGVLDASGNYPKGSINAIVQSRWAEKLEDKKALSEEKDQKILF